MAIHKRREHGKPAARMLLESAETVELPPAEINEAGVTVEREEFRPFLDELLEVLREGGVVDPAPMVMSDSIFVIHGESRTFWVRLWHTDETRAQIDRLHVSACLPRAQDVWVDLGEEDAADDDEEGKP
jgi:hypothetical protein